MPSSLVTPDNPWDGDALPTQPLRDRADNAGMPRRARRQTIDTIAFRIQLTGEDITRWQVAADERGMTLEQLVRVAIERLMVAPRKRTIAG